MCEKWILVHIYYAFGFAPKTGCDNWTLYYSLPMSVTSADRWGLELLTVEVFCLVVHWTVRWHTR
jgi:hypothetical protein